MTIIGRVRTRRRNHLPSYHNVPIEIYWLAYILYMDYIVLFHCNFLFAEIMLYNA